MSLLRNYWGNGRKYHHTAPVNMTYAIREALLLLAEEGIDQSWKRHRENAENLWAGLRALGLECHVPEDHRLTTLTTVRVPDAVDAKAVTQTLLEEHNIEIGNGLGELAGKVWRIGLMGYNSQPQNVNRILDALQNVLAKQK
jgi:alanine-glyoxylate transaminase/serine-glyoxylate transaminase/serine-pyruvate transaminase